jgi:putative Holliday junction resolvase
MNRVLAVDYGLKRVGFAVSDALGMIANPLTVAETPVALKTLLSFIAEYNCTEVVIGLSKNLRNEENPIELEIRKFIEALLKKNPGVNIIRMDERFTSKIAMQGLIDGGFSKKQRRDKGNLDKMSAAIILQDYLNQRV